MASPESNHPHAKHGRSTAQLRRRIVAGEWQPGHRLPRRVELIEAFESTVTTLQKALDRLARIE